jgi:ATP-dependent DNA helicase RecG
MEQVGSGIMRMNDLMKEAGLPLPEFITEGMFTIKLQRGPETVEKLGDKLGDKPFDKLKEKTREKILEILSFNNRVTIPELAEMLNITYKGVQYHLTGMKKEGIIIREGSRKAGYWKIIHENNL